MPAEAAPRQHCCASNSAPTQSFRCRDCRKRNKHNNYKVSKKWCLKFCETSVSRTASSRVMRGPPRQQRAGQRPRRRLPSLQRSRLRGGSEPHHSGTAARLVACKEIDRMPLRVTPRKRSGRRVLCPVRQKKREEEWRRKQCGCRRNQGVSGPRADREAVDDAIPHPHTAALRRAEQFFIQYNDGERCI